jgi:hypothetical protein
MLEETQQPNRPSACNARRYRPPWEARLLESWPTGKYNKLGITSLLLSVQEVLLNMSPLALSKHNRYEIFSNITGWA